MEIEEENPYYGLSALLGEEPVECLCAMTAVAQLSRYIREFESTLDDIFNKENISKEQCGYIKGLKDKMTDCCSRIQKAVKHEVNIREQEGNGATALNEITELFNLVSDKIKKGNTVLEKIVTIDESMEKDSIINCLEKEKSILDAYVSAAAKIFDPLYMFFGLVNNEKTAYELCSHPSINSVVFKALLKRPLVLDRVYARWYGQDGLAEQYRSRLYSQIDALADVLYKVYENAATQSKELRGQIKELNKEITHLQFEIYELYRKDLAENSQKAYGAYGYYCNRNNREGGIANEEKNKEKQKRYEREQLHKGIGDSYCNLPNHQTGLVQDCSNGMCSSTSPLGCLLKKAVELIISRSFLDDVQGNMVIATGKGKYLLADLTHRLWIGSEPLVDDLQERIPSAAMIFQPARKYNLAIDSCCHRLAHILHTVIVHGHRNAHVIQELPEKINEGEKKAKRLLPNYEKRVAGMIKAAERVGNSVDTVKNGISFTTYALAAAYNFLGNLLVPDIDSGKDSNGKKEGEDKKSENGILSKKVRRFVFEQTERSVEYSGKAKKITQNAVEKITELVTTNRQDIDRLDAISLILGHAANADPRTRNLGDGQFRQWFDQLGNVWDDPARVLGPE